MRITIAAIGRLKAGPERQLVERYVERVAKAGKAVALGPVAVREFAESRAERTDDRRRAETDQLIEATAGATRLIALDERGKTITSADFAALPACATTAPARSPSSSAAPTATTSACATAPIMSSRSGR